MHRYVSHNHWVFNIQCLFFFFLEDIFLAIKAGNFEIKKYIMEKKLCNVTLRHITSNPSELSDTFTYENLPGMSFSIYC